MIACPTEPTDADTIVARAVAMNSALPRPQRARKATMPGTAFCDPASPAPTMMMARPNRSVRLAPRRLEMYPVMSIATAMTPLYDVNSKDTWEGVAERSSAIGLRIGSTSPMPMKAITQANATDQTVLG